jgi:hypothetical protein
MRGAGVHRRLLAVLSDRRVGRLLRCAGADDRIRALSPPLDAGGDHHADLGPIPCRNRLILQIDTATMIVDMAVSGSDRALTTTEGLKLIALKK